MEVSITMVLRFELSGGDASDVRLCAILVALGVPVFKTVRLPWMGRLPIIQRVSVLRNIFLGRLDCLLPQVGNGVGREVRKGVSKHACSVRRLDSKDA